MGTLGPSLGAQRAAHDSALGRPMGDETKYPGKFIGNDSSYPGGIICNESKYEGKSIRKKIPCEIHGE